LWRIADTIKTRLQFQGTLKHVKHYNNFVHAFRVILRDEGYGGFTRGLPARLTYVTPAAGEYLTLDVALARAIDTSFVTGVSFLCYEKLIAALKKPKVWLMINC